MLETICIITFTLLFIFLAWKKLDWAIYFTIVFLPIYLLRFQVWFLPMTFLEVMLLVIFVVWVVKMQKSKIKMQNLVFPWKWVILLFVLTGIVAVLISPDTRAALGLWKAYILEPVLFFIVLVNVIKTEKQVRKVIWALGVSAVLIGFGALVQYIGLADIPEPYGLESPMRATSIYPFPTAIGKYIGPILALFLGLILIRRDKKAEEVGEVKKQRWANLFLWGVIGFSLLSLILSFSRAALIGVFVAMIFISFFSKWKKWIWLGLFIILLLVFLIPQTRENITNVFSKTDISTDVRLVMWKGTLRIIKDNPIAGTGLASFPIVYEDYKEASHVEYFPNPDHLILSLWVEMGLAGLVVFFWLVVKFFKAGIVILRRLRTTDYGLQLVVGLLAAMIAILIHGFFDTPYFKNDLAVEFLVLVGLVLILSRTGQKAENAL